MESTNWQKQSKDRPLFPDMLWSRPENRRHAGKLLIIGGHKQSFAAVSTAYAAAEKSGIGTARVMLPGSLERMLAQVFPEAEFTPSTPSGSFSQTSQGLFCDAAAWADAVLIAGDLGKNSETAIALEGFIKKYSGNLILTGDCLDYFFSNQDVIIKREQTVCVGKVSQIQKLLLSKALIKQSADLVQFIGALANFTHDYPVSIVAYHNSNIVVASGGQVSSTLASDVDYAGLAAYASVWKLQQPGKTFEALTTAAYCYLV